jgi:adenylosuccinate lyase
MDHLVVYPETMKANLARSRGLIFSEGIMLKLVRKGLSREDAYALVQRVSFRALKGKKELEAVLLKDQSILRYLRPKEIQEVFNLTHCLRHVDEIFRRVFGGQKT